MWKGDLKTTKCRYEILAKQDGSIYTFFSGSGSGKFRCPQIKTLMMIRLKIFNQTSGTAPKENGG